MQAIHSCCSQISGNPLLNMNRIPEGKTEKTWKQRNNL